MTLLVENRGPVRILTMNRPEKRNALNFELAQGLLDALRAADADESVGALVLTGAGVGFCAGADLQKNVSGGAFAVDFSRPKHYIVDLFKRMQECPLPIVVSRPPVSRRPNPIQMPL